MCFNYHLNLCEIFSFPFALIVDLHTKCLFCIGKQWFLIEMSYGTFCCLLSDISRDFHRLAPFNVVVLRVIASVYSCIHEVEGAVFLGKQYHKITFSFSVEFDKIISFPFYLCVFLSFCFVFFFVFFFVGLFCFVGRTKCLLLCLA